MTNEELREFFVYETVGILRKIKQVRKPYPWRKAGTFGKYFMYTHVNGKCYYLHRLIWQYHHGYLPPMVDHINNDTYDNRIENLRPCDNAKNQYNSRKKVNNKSGYKGVVFHPRVKNRPWQSKIVVNKKVVSLGYYSTPEQAHEAYKVAADKYAGEFSRYN